MKKLILGFVFATLGLFAFVFTAKAAGFDEYGYNWTARIFNGPASGWCQYKYGDSNCLGIYSNDKLVMKWNAEWDRGNAENWANPPYGAWEDNEWNGLGNTNGSGEVWHYKIIWVGLAQWDVTGTWLFNFMYQGTPYIHSADLTQTGGAVTGDGGYPAGGPYQYHWNVTSGNVTDNQIHLTMDYDLGVPFCTMTMDGTIANDGTIVNGTWSDDCWGLNRTGTWTGTGTAVLNNGPYWREGGVRIWNQFETIMDQGKDPSLGPGHFWFTHANPTGYGAY